MIEILPNRVRMGSPWPCAGAKAPSKTLIVLGQSCKRIRGSQSWLKKNSSQVVHCDRCPLEDFSISPLPHPHPATLCTSVTHPSHPSLSVLLSWERAARGDPGLLNLLPKTLALKVGVYVCLCICVCACLFVFMH